MQQCWYNYYHDTSALFSVKLATFICLSYDVYER